MELTTPFKLGLALLAALVLACILILLFGDEGPGSVEDDYLLDDVGDGGRSRGPMTVDGGPGGPGAGKGLARPGGGKVRPHMRVPAGLDLSDPAVRASELERLIGAEEINWREVAKILAVMDEPVPEKLREAFLLELRAGRRGQVMHAFAALNDGSFTEDLFDLLDDPEAARAARASALQALWRMPGAEPDDVARRLEGRLTYDFAQDRDVLYAIAARGGKEAARALVQYLGETKDPAAIPPYILQTLNVQDQPEAAAVVVDALGEPQSPAVMTALIAMAAKPGASAYTQALVDLDREGQPEEIRVRALSSLGAIGDEKAVAYLLEKAEEPGLYGDKALQAVSRIRSADPAARKKLVEALDSAEQNPRPRRAKESLLLAVGALRDTEALPVVARHLDDPDARVRSTAAQSLGRMGAAARPHVSRLVGIYEKGDERTRIRVAVALGSIGGEEAVAAMQSMLKAQGLSPSLERTLGMGLRAAEDQLVRSGGGDR